MVRLQTPSHRRCQAQPRLSHHRHQSGGQRSAGERATLELDTLVALTDAIPTAVVVIACLEDYFKVAKNFLTMSKLDRLERDPEPVRLQSARTRPQVETLVAKRLEVLYEAFRLTLTCRLSPSNRNTSTAFAASGLAT